MTKPTNDHLQTMHREALEARFASRVRARLDDSAASLPHDISERLRIARTQAIAAARQGRIAAETAALVASPVAVTQSGLQLAGGPSTPSLQFHWPQWLLRLKSPSKPTTQKHPEQVSWAWRMACAGPFIALVVGLWGIHVYQQTEYVEATTTVDMELLVDDLPPDAYADPGFEAYLHMRENDPDLDMLLDAPDEISGDLVSAEPPALSVAP